MTKVDQTYAIGRSVPVQGDPITAVKAAYNDIAKAFQAGGREPALVVLTVYAKPKEPT
jgi:hypothetical protein